MVICKYLNTKKSYNYPILPVHFLFSYITNMQTVKYSIIRYTEEKYKEGNIAGMFLSFIVNMNTNIVWSFGNVLLLHVAFAKVSM